MQLKDYCSVTAEGRNMYVFINAVRQSSIICMEQHCMHNAFCCRVRRTDLDELQHLADTYGMTLKIEKKKSMQRTLRHYQLRFGLTAGILLGACIIFWQSNVVETIEIQGNSSVSSVTILNVLENEGVSRGTWIAGIDMTHCERTVRSVIPDIAWCGIRHTGNRLVVEVTEMTPPPDMLQERTPCNIVSRYDAQITDVQVYSGHLQRMIGDGVAAGDLLVSGVHEGVTGQTTFNHSLASITGIYTQEIELTEYLQNSETIPTGQSTTQRWLHLFGLNIPLGFSRPDYIE
ncbi:MAG: sporulation protein YqfD, partial [Oscillospiraceae bacterium]|nr:sporulation protein YqfD [Oscillospiraceae bacterium]